MKLRKVEKENLTSIKNILRCGMYYICTTCFVLRHKIHALRLIYVFSFVVTSLPRTVGGRYLLLINKNKNLKKSSETGTDAGVCCLFIIPVLVCVRVCTFVYTLLKQAPSDKFITAWQ